MITNKNKAILILKIVGIYEKLYYNTVRDISIELGGIIMLRRNIRNKVVGTILSASMLFVSIAPSFAESIRNNSSEQKVVDFQNDYGKFEFAGIKNVSVLQQDDNLVKYFFEQNGERYFAEENVIHTGTNTSVESSIYKIDMYGNKILHSTEKTELEPDKNRILTISKNSRGDIIDSKEDIYSDVVSEFTDEAPVMHYRAAKKIQYGVYKYNRTIRGHRNIRAYKYSVGVLASILASMVGGPAGAFFSVAAFFAGTSYDEIWSVTQVYHKYNRNLRHRTKFVMSFYSDSSRRHKVGPTSTYIEKGLR